MSPVSPEKISLLCTADDSFAMGVAVTVTSLAINTSREGLDLYLMDAGISKQNRQMIAQTMAQHHVQLIWLQVDQEIFQDAPLSGHVAIATYYRLLIGEVLPKTVERVIYLDSDLVILDDLQEIWSLGIPPGILRAVVDQNVQTVGSPLGLLNYQDLNLPSDTPYFNAGFLDINCKRWRSQDITTKAIDYLKNHRASIRWHDQDILNAILAGQWEKLSARWNRPITIHRFQRWQDSPYSESIFQQLLHDPAVVHYTESGKPWTPGFKHPERHLFFHYLKSTAWNHQRVIARLWIQRLKAQVWGLGAKAMRQTQRISRPFIKRRLEI